MNVFRKNWIHFVIWAVMLTYITAAIPFHTQYILRGGKPIAFNEELPKNTKNIAFSVGRLDPVVLRGQNLYHLLGWAFVQEHPDPAAYERFIILKSGNNIYFFTSVSQVRPDVQAQFPDLQLPLNTGFSTHISKDVLPRGTYRIGYLFRHRTSDLSYYLLSDTRIIRTPNTLELLAP